jgi:hypothetical protein
VAGVVDGLLQVEMVLLSVVAVVVEAEVALQCFLERLPQVKQYLLQLDQRVLLEAVAVAVQEVQAVQVVYLIYHEVLQYYYQPTEV